MKKRKNLTLGHIYSRNCQIYYKNIYSTTKVLEIYKSIEYRRSIKSLHQGIIHNNDIDVEFKRFYNSMFNVEPLYGLSFRMEWSRKRKRPFYLFLTYILSGQEVLAQNKYKKKFFDINFHSNGKVVNFFKNFLSNCNNIEFFWDIGNNKETTLLFRFDLKKYVLRFFILRIPFILSCFQFIRKHFKITVQILLNRSYYINELFYKSSDDFYKNYYEDLEKNNALINQKKEKRYLEKLKLSKVYKK